MRIFSSVQLRFSILKILDDKHFVVFSQVFALFFYVFFLSLDHQSCSTKPTPILNILPCES